MVFWIPGSIYRHWRTLGRFHGWGPTEPGSPPPPPPPPPPPADGSTECLDAAYPWPIQLMASIEHDRDCEGIGMGARNQRIKIENEVDPVLKFTMANNVDITSWQISFYLAKTVGAANPSGFPKTVGSGITITDTDTFQVAFSTDNPSVLLGGYAFVAKRTDAGFRGVLADGVITVKQTADPP